MSDVESEVTETAENPNPESDFVDNGDVQNVAAAIDVVNNPDVAHLNVDDDGDDNNVNNENVGTEDDGIVAQPPIQPFVQHDVNDNNDDSNVEVNDEENASGLLAEGDQFGISDNIDVNNCNSLAAEDEQYLVQELGGCDNVRHGNNVDDDVWQGAASSYNNHPVDRTESSSQLEEFAPAASDPQVNERQKIRNAELDEGNVEGHCASAEGELFLVPESEADVINAGADASFLENEPTESDQEAEEASGGVSFQSHQVEDEIERVEINTVENCPQGTIEGSHHASVSAENQPILEDELGALNLNQEPLVDSYEPECDQSEIEIQNSDSIASSQGDLMCSESARGETTADTVSQSEDGQNKDNVLIKNDELVTKTDNDKSLSESANCIPQMSGVDDKLNLSKDKGAIPKQKVKANYKSNGIGAPACDTKSVDSLDLTEDDLLNELDATLSHEPVENSRCDKMNNPDVHLTDSHGDFNDTNSAMVNDMNKDSGDSCDQCRKNNVQCSFKNSRKHDEGKSGVKELKGQLKQANHILMEKEYEINRLKEDLEDHRTQCDKLKLERDTCRKELDRLKQHNPDDLYIPQIKELEYTIAQQESEIKGLKDKLTSHDASAKRAIATLQQEMKIRVEQVTKQYEEARREKDSMVVKYAQAEHKNLECQKQAERAESRLREIEKERGAFMDKMKAVKEARSKLAVELEAKIVELSNVNKDLDKHREMVSSADTRVKWSQSKLKAELEAHKDTKNQLEKMTIKLKEAKEETQQIRHDCQAMIKTYQESEEVKSNSLDKELKQKETELLENQMQRTNFELAHVKTQRELEQMKGELVGSHNQLSTLKAQVSSLEGEKDQAIVTVTKYGEIIQKQKKEVQELRERVESLVQYKTDFVSAQEMIKTLDGEISELKISNKELIADMDSCRQRESDKLELTAKLSRKNAELQSENTALSNKVLTLTGELEAIKIETQDVDSKLKEMSTSLEREQKLRQEEAQRCNTKLAGKCKAVEDLTRKLDDEKDEIKTLKRKHTNNVKDLTRQLQQVKRKLETYEATTNGDKDTISMGSRTSSNGSINTVGIAEQTVTHVVHPSQPQNSLHRNPSPEQEYPVITEQVEVDKQTLIDRIVKLQKNLARKNDKLEFMDDHINQLIDEIQKKNKILQTYMLKEDTGTMTSDLRDQTKAEISRKHSIMGSVYSSQSTDGTMTLDLSLQINRKLQAVLEDTLLKNMTLKENLDTLGTEIARLSQENRRMQLSMQSGVSRGRSNPAHR